MAEVLKKKRILHIITKSNWGGAQRHVYDLAIGTPKEEFEVSVACGGRGIFFKKLSEAGIRTFPLLKLQRDFNFFSDILSFLEILEIIKNEKPDILHLHSPKAGGLGALAGILAKVPKVIYTAHGWPFKEDRKKWQKWTIYCLSWLTSVMVDKIITVSRDDENKAPVYLLDGKIETIYPGIGKQRLASQKAARQKILDRFSLPSNEKYLIIGCIAELHKNKGLEYLIEAVKQVILANKTKERIILCVIGEGEEEKALLKKIEDNNVKDNVFLFGYLDNASYWLRAFDIFVLPSIKEGLPYVILEAGYARLPVIATSVGGIPEIIEDMHSGLLVRSKSAKDLEYAIRFLINEKEKAKLFGKNLQQKIKEEFSLETMLEKTLAIYRN
jgi:glycosyltransferase involved in cell wall biosynthesis